MTEGMPKPDKPGGDLNVEAPPRSMARRTDALPDLFSSGMNDNKHLPRLKDLPKAIKRPNGLRVDQHQPIRRGYLDQAQFGMKGMLANKLSIEPDRTGLGEMVHRLLELRRLVDEPLLSRHAHHEPSRNNGGILDFLREAYSIKCDNVW